MRKTNKYKKKIAFIGNVPEPTGGAEVFLKELISNLLYYHDMHVVLARWLVQEIDLGGTARIRYKYRENESVELSYNGYLKTYYLFKQTFDYGFLKLCQAISDSFKLTLFLFREHISLIHCHLLAPNIYYSFIAAKFLKKPLVVTIHGSVDIIDQGYFFKIPFFQRIEEKVLHYILCRCERVIAVSNEIVKLCHERKINKVLQIGCGIDINFFMPKDVDEEGLLFIGNLTRRKGFDLLIAAYNQIKNEINEPLFIAGKNPYNYAFNDSRIKYIGCIKNSKLRHFIQKAKIIILPSETEGLPICILEALSCNKIILVSKVGELRYLIKEGENGFFIDKLTADDITLKIKYILNNYSTLRMQLGGYPRKTVIKYDINNVVYNHIKIYNNLI